jgi:hypothetical protein
MAGSDRWETALQTPGCVIGGASGSDIGTGREGKGAARCLQGEGGWWISRCGVTRAAAQRVPKVGAQREGRDESIQVSAKLTRRDLGRQSMQIVGSGPGRETT